MKTDGTFYLYDADELNKIAAEEGIDFDPPLTCGLQVAPSPLTREQIIAALRTLAAIPDDSIDLTRPFAMHGD